MDYQRVMTELHQGKLAPVYYLQGSEKYLIDQFLKQLFNTLEKDQALDIMQIDLEEESIQSVIDEANMFSFFADQRIIIVDNASFLANQSPLKLNKTEEKNLSEYISSPNSATVVVFLSRQDQIDRRRKLSQLFTKQTLLVDVTPLDERQVDRFVREYLRSSEIKLGKHALDELLIRVNYQLSLAMIELEKLHTFALSGQELSVENVRQLVPRSLETDVFELSTAVSQGKVNQAIQIYQDLLLMKNEPIALHALLVSQFRLILQVKLLKERGMMPGQMAEYLSVHPYRVKLAYQTSQRKTLPALLALYDDFAEIDYQMKMGIGQAENHFYLLLTKIVSS
ncbi:DNA polymerase III subunit delta [Ignavigranum ruoffiae]|uniref:DNA polymerase III subunit delta n=1 Tax=Ignavigranum ruoffiae TaxID=89093 RepID=A0A1H8YX33_9LACT|nr:DNA polymerase III subunit delta [Ignavigranum ruoffiae]SEP56643.1 DNA polymerase III, delta subunit [Ignavigranum ruoffiae]